MNLITSIHRNRKAFTLVETAVALGIFGVAIISAYALIASSLRNIRANREHAYIARVLESTMENVRHLSWTELTAQPTQQTFDATKPLVPLFGKSVNPSASKDTDFQATSFTPTGTIRIETVVGQPDLRKVIVEVTHDSSAGGSQVENSLVTLISKNGIDRR